MNGMEGIATDESESMRLDVPLRGRSASSRFWFLIEDLHG